MFARASSSLALALVLSVQVCHAGTLPSPEEYAQEVADFSVVQYTLDGPATALQVTAGHVSGAGPNVGSPKAYMPSQWQTSEISESGFKFDYTKDWVGIGIPAFHGSYNFTITCVPGPEGVCEGMLPVRDGNMNGTELTALPWASNVKLSTPLDIVIRIQTKMTVSFTVGWNTGSRFGALFVPLADPSKPKFAGRMVGQSLLATDSQEPGTIISTTTEHIQMSVTIAARAALHFETTSGVSGAHGIEAPRFVLFVDQVTGADGTNRTRVTGSEFVDHVELTAGAQHQRQMEVTSEAELWTDCKKFDVANGGTYSRVLWFCGGRYEQNYALSEMLYDSGCYTTATTSWTVINYLIFLLVAPTSDDNRDLVHASGSPLRRYYASLGFSKPPDR
ncbi:hypothetical protein BKA62DRAFT_789580 [Auriculariales sp. MPI-PUGE-AT-0066]|nr:hypothetical protein BKA62DRAFT_789580 [Auriculariales sp. MPI-PUGE-AT-0066]